MLSGEATNTNFIVLGLTRPGFEPTIYCTRGEHANHRCGAFDWCYHVNIMSQYDSSPPLTACKILVILIDSSFIEQVEEYICLNTDSSEISVSNIKLIIHNFLHLPAYSVERLSKGTCTCTCNRGYSHKFCVLHHQFCSAYRSTRSWKLVVWRPFLGKNL